MPIDRQTEIIATLREQIVEGALPPGRRLPTRLELEKRFQASPHTIQRAMNQLKDDGFIHASGSVGTYVSRTPPHLYNYAIVVPEARLWSRYYTTLHGAIRNFKTDEPLRLQEYRTSRDFGIRGGVNKLCRDVRSHRLAGLIFAGPPEDLVGTPALEQQGIPRVLIQDWPEYKLPEIVFDTESFLDLATEYLFARGRRRIAHLSLDFSSRQQDAFIASLRRHGLEVRPYWLQAIPMQSLYRAAANVVHLLMQLEGDKRPNGLIIHDDNLVEHAMAGLMAAGVKVPDEIEVVVQCNYPSPVSSVLPVRQVGFDCRKMLTTCLDLLQMQRQGRTPPAMTTIPADYLLEDTNVDKRYVRDANKT